MTSNLKISFVAVLVLILTFSILIILEHTIAHDFIRIDEFYTNDFSNHGTILLLGSSHVGSINATYVNGLVSSDGSVLIYNLAEIDDTPIERLNDLPKIISIKPEIVFYGISYRDFSFTYDEPPTSILPDPSQIFSCFSDSGFNNLTPSNPKLLTLKIIDKTLGNYLETQSNRFVAFNTPFYPYLIDPPFPSNNTLTKMVTSPISESPNKTKQNICALNKIISNLHSHDIDVVLFTTPLHSSYLESLSDSQKNNFSILQANLINTYGIKIYDFEDKYSQLNIWADASHVSTHQNIKKFNNDIAKMIKMEIDL